MCIRDSVCTATLHLGTEIDKWLTLRSADLRNYDRLGRTSSIYKGWRFLVDSLSHLHWHQVHIAVSGNIAVAFFRYTVDMFAK